MANYDLNSITHGNNTYNCKDTSKIPLAGTNALSGHIVPDTNDTCDLGSSSKNYRMVYAREVRNGLNTGALTLCGGSSASNGAYLAVYGANRSDGFQGRFDLVAKGSSDYKLTGLPNGNLTWSGKNIDTIEEQGNDYIRYANGLQICWGEYTRTSESNATINFPKAFYNRTYPISVSVAGQSSTVYALGWTASWVLIGNTNIGSFMYTAIGRWK